MPHEALNKLIQEGTVEENPLSGQYMGPELGLYGPCHAQQPQSIPGQTYPRAQRWPDMLSADLCLCCCHKHEERGILLRNSDMGAMRIRSRELQIWSQEWQHQTSIAGRRPGRPWLLPERIQECRQMDPFESRTPSEMCMIHWIHLSVLCTAEDRMAGWPSPSLALPSSLMILGKPAMRTSSCSSSSAEVAEQSRLPPQHPQLKNKNPWNHDSFQGWIVVGRWMAVHGEHWRKQARQYLSVFWLMMLFAPWNPKHSVGIRASIVSWASFSANHLSAIIKYWCQ